jgi:hypothetical protein
MNVNTAHSEIGSELGYRHTCVMRMTRRLPAAAVLFQDFGAPNFVPRSLPQAHWQNTKETRFGLLGRRAAQCIGS